MTTYYVSALGGSDSNAGTSSASALATLQVAANKVQAGDTVEVMDGTYTNGFSVSHSGTSSAPITFEAAAGQHPVISAGGQWYGIDVNNASWIVISGFEVAGGAQSVSLSYAQSQENNTGNPVTAGNGINVHGTSSHVVIENNYVHDWSGAGIGALQGDYFSILNNVVTGNAHWSPYGASDISMGFLKADDSTTGYHNFISGNVSHDNAEYIPFHLVGTITDGNGIIVDSNNDSGYTGRTLVSNNLSYHNGGTGMHAIKSDHVDFLYNTTYQNDQVINNGEISAFYSSDVRAENNIMVASSGKRVDQAAGGANDTYDYNIYYGGSPSVIGAHSIIADPMFVSPGSDFSLTSTSPAINAGNPSLPSGSDIDGNSRPSGSGYDIGAYEFQGASQPPPPPTGSVPSPDGTKIISPDDAPIIDQAGNSWTLVRSDSEGLQIAVNGTVDPITGNVVLLETLNGSMIQQNSSDQWFSKSSPSDQWTQIDDPSSGSVPTDKLSLILSEDARKGNAQFVAKVDGNRIGGPTSVTALDRYGQTQEFDFSGDWGAGRHTVEIDFVNPARGRHLYVDQVNYNSTPYLSSPHEMTNSTPFNVVVGQ